MFMRIEEKNIVLPEGRFTCSVQVYEPTDDAFIKGLYAEWIGLSLKLRNFGGRGINLPEVLSEAVFCRAMNTVRIKANIPGANTSFDVYDLTRSKRIQVKACSVLPDLTSFGPESVWDEIYFMDFFRQGAWDGSIDIYSIPNDLIYNYQVNVNQTLRDQQRQGRRPRFSIFSGIIENEQISPIKTYRI
jgi:hypothetical protein